MKVAIICVVVIASLLADTSGQETFEFKCGVEELQEKVMTRMDTLEGKQDAVQGQNSELQEKLDNVDGSLDDVKGNLDDVKGNLGDMKGKLDDVNEKVESLERNLEELNRLLQIVIANTGPQWVVIQRRGQFGNPTNFFAKTMDEYKTGFGTVYKEFWLGLDELARLTKDGNWEMQVDLVDYAGKTYTGVYHKFRVGAGPRYELEVGEYDSSKSTMGKDVFSVHNRMAFSTKDVDQDTKPDASCSNEYGQGGWWYKSCYQININGDNSGTKKNDNTGMRVYRVKRGEDWVMMKETEMKMKKKV